MAQDAPPVDTAAAYLNDAGIALERYIIKELAEGCPPEVLVSDLCEIFDWDEMVDKIMKAPIAQPVVDAVSVGILKRMRRVSRTCICASQPMQPVRRC